MPCLIESWISKQAGAEWKCKKKCLSFRLWSGWLVGWFVGSLSVCGEICLQMLFESCDDLSRLCRVWKFIHRKESARVRVLESDLVPHCEGPARCHSFSDRNWREHTFIEVYWGKGVQFQCQSLKFDFGSDCGVNQERCDVGPLWLIEDQTYCCVLDHLQRLSHADWKAGQ